MGGGEPGRGIYGYGAGVFWVFSHWENCGPEEKNMIYVHFRTQRINRWFGLCLIRGGNLIRMLIIELIFLL